ncbi:hypothetical protein ACFL6N_03000 [Thermodesulfobacteriota bacterium]
MRAGYLGLFNRFLRSFPSGGAADLIAQDLREQAEAIFEQLAAGNMDWVQRQEARQKLLHLVDQEPLLLEVYRQEIITFFPALTNRYPEGD